MNKVSNILNIKAVVLGAGKGTRISSDEAGLPKVMRMAGDKPLLSYVLDNLGFIDKKDIILVVGFMKETITGAFPDYPFAVQDKQLGTGHAVAAAGSLLNGYDGDVLVCYGDMPLIRKNTYQALIDQHRSENNECTILAGRLDEKVPYGRIVRDAAGAFLKIAEQKDCTEQEDKIREYNSGVYVFECRSLLSALKNLNNQNAQGEYYITDVPGILKDRGKKVGICTKMRAEELIGVNTKEQLEQVTKLLCKR
jgi:UDP-N-acetylglucosamine diphosphorylase/glucosamine-1-phosphate N-acetyltransferase